MSDISRSITHGMSLEDAKAKTEQIVTAVQNEFPAVISGIDWNGDKTAAKVKGKGFEGDFRVNAQVMSIDIKLGMLAKPFKSKIEQKIDERISSYFA